MSCLSRGLPIFLVIFSLVGCSWTLGNGTGDTNGSDTNWGNVFKTLKRHESFLYGIDGDTRRIRDDIHGLRRDISDIMRFIRRPCPPGFAVANDFLGSCYRFSEEGKEVLWIDAVNTCYNHSAYLVEIHSQEEFDYLLPMMKERGGDFWLGGSDIQHEGKWTWRRTRLNFRFSKWGGMEPNGTVVENCLRAYQGYGYLWGDAHCGKDPTAFICEYDTKLK